MCGYIKLNSSVSYRESENHYKSYNKCTYSLKNLCVLWYKTFIFHNFVFLTYTYYCHPRTVLVMYNAVICNTLWSLCIDMMPDQTLNKTNIRLGSTAQHPISFETTTTTRVYKWQKKGPFTAIPQTRSLPQFCSCLWSHSIICNK